MRKWIVLLLIATLLVSCGVKEQEDVQSETEEQKVTESAEEESIKDRAIKANFVEVNGGEIEEGTALYVEGEVSVVFKKIPLGSFSIQTQEDDGLGVYDIVNNVVTDVNEGDKVIVYGVYSGKDKDTGIPTIIPTIIEFNKASE